MRARWLSALAWVSLGTSFACAAAVLSGILIIGLRQHVRVMEWVWPITAVYAGPFALWCSWLIRRGVKGRM